MVLREVVAGDKRGKLKERGARKEVWIGAGRVLQAGQPTSHVCSVTRVC